ncbi:MAG: DEAD/DEAH box helicase [Candidatus Omnitrophota bacterium]
MSISEILSSHSLPQEVIDVIIKSGISELYPPQQEAIKSGVLNKRNLVVATPTASGKTLIAELCMLKNILTSQGTCIYIVPLKALASEKYEDFKEKYAPLGINIGLATGDYDHAAKNLTNFQIIVATSEKIDSLLRHRPVWLLDKLSTIIIDEIHLIGDIARGPTLEVLIARLRQIKNDLQFLALSATIANADEIAKWLNASLVNSNWRPVPLKQGVYCHEKIYFEDSTTCPIAAKHQNAVVSLCADTLTRGGQTLVFVNSRRSTHATALEISKYIANTLSQKEKAALSTLSSSIENTLGEATKICRKLAACIRGGAAFHHAGLHFKQRKLVEDGFRNNLIKVICSTPTLAAGVNLPSQRTIIRDYFRYNSITGRQTIAVFEYKQMSGRAGRPQYDSFGESVLIAKTEYQAKCLFEEYIFASPEPITSYLNNEPVLSTHILASIVGGYVYTIEQILEFLKQTFFAYQQEYSSIENSVFSCLDFLEREKMIIKTKNHISPTTFGAKISKLYLNPLTGVILREGLKSCALKSINNLQLLFLICTTPDMPCLNLSKHDYTEVEKFFAANHLTLQPLLPDGLDEENYQIIKTVYFLNSWIAEQKEETICEKFNIGPGDIRRFIESAVWLLYSTGQLAPLFNLHILKPVQHLKTRVRYGIKEELINFVMLSGIGRVRARNIYKKGCHSISALKKASTDQIAKIPHIGTALAKSIKQQLFEEPKTSEKNIWEI